MAPLFHRILGQKRVQKLIDIHPQMFSCPQTTQQENSTCPSSKFPMSDKSGMGFPHPCDIPLYMHTGYGFGCLSFWFPVIQWWNSISYKDSLCVRKTVWILIRHLRRPRVLSPHRSLRNEVDLVPLACQDVDLGFQETWRQGTNFWKIYVHCMLIRSNTYLLYYLIQHTTLVKIIGYFFKQTLARAQAKKKNHWDNDCGWRTSNPNTSLTQFQLVSVNAKSKTKGYR